MKIGLFGDSYISPGASWISLLGKKDSQLEIDCYGKGGSNLFHAINSFHNQLTAENALPYDIVAFTFTWHERLFSSWNYRNEQFCAYSEFRRYDQNNEFDPEIIDEIANGEFKKTIENYAKYMYDDRWRLFDFELELKYILELPKQYTNTKFIFIPNTELSRELAKKYFTQGVLMDFAFETVSNREPNSPGTMPINDRRVTHLNYNNHCYFADLFYSVIINYTQLQDKILAVDINKFDIIR